MKAEWNISMEVGLKSLALRHKMCIFAVSLRVEKRGKTLVEFLILSLVQTEFETTLKPKFPGSFVYTRLPSPCSIFIRTREISRALQ